MSILVLTGIGELDTHDNANDWNVEPCGALTIQYVNPPLRGLITYIPGRIQQLFTYAPLQWQRVSRDT